MLLSFSFQPSIFFISLCKVSLHQSCLGSFCVPEKFHFPVNEQQNHSPLPNQPFFRLFHCSLSRFCSLSSFSSSLVCALPPTTRSFHVSRIFWTNNRSAFALLSFSSQVNKSEMISIFAFHLKRGFRTCQWAVRQLGL